MSLDKDTLKDFMQGGSIAVTSSGVNITLERPITTYLIHSRCVDANNVGASVDFTNIKPEGFTATSDRDGTLYWVVIRAGGY